MAFQGRTKLVLQPTMAQVEGLTRYAALEGASGRCYVFSAIDWSQATLYDRAVFAVEGADRCVRLSRRPPLRSVGAGEVLHVHMLADGCEAEALCVDVTDGGRIAA